MGRPPARPDRLLIGLGIRPGPLLELRTRNPCADCPASYMLDMAGVGRCDLYAISPDASLRQLVTDEQARWRYLCPLRTN